jgi:hypothetical protein
MSKEMNAGLIKELSGSAKRKYTGALVVNSKDSSLTGRVYFYDGAVYAVEVDGFYPRIVARMAASGNIDLNREEHLRQHFGGNIVDPEIGAYTVQQGWLAVDELSAMHQEYLLASLGALVSLPHVRTKRHKSETTNLFCTVPLPWEKVEDTLTMRAMRFTNTWATISASDNPAEVIPQIVNPAALASMTAPEVRTLAAAIDGSTNVDEIAWRCGFTRAEAVHLLAMMVVEGAVAPTRGPSHSVDSDNLFVPEAAGVLLSQTVTVEPKIQADNQPPDEHDAFAFGETNPDAVDQVHEVKEVKKKSGFFGFGKGKKNDESVEDLQENEYDADEWVVHELSENAVTGYEMSNDPYAEAVASGNEISNDSFIPGDTPIEEEVEEPVAEVVEEFIPEEIIVNQSQNDGFLTQWVTVEHGNKRDIRLAVLMRMIESAKADVKEKELELISGQAALTRASTELAASQKYWLSRQLAREASDSELLTLEAIRDNAKGELDSAVEAHELTTSAVIAKAEEIIEVGNEAVRLREALASIDSKIAVLEGEKISLLVVDEISGTSEDGKTEMLSEAALRVHEFKSSHHGQAVEKEALARTEVDEAGVVERKAFDIQSNLEVVLKVSQDVLSEATDEINAASGVSQ